MRELLACHGQLSAVLSGSIGFIGVDIVIVTNMPLSILQVWRAAECGGDVILIIYRSSGFSRVKFIDCRRRRRCRMPRALAARRERICHHRAGVRAGDARIGPVN